MEQMTLCVNGRAVWAGSLSGCKAVSRDFIPSSGNADQTAKRFVISSGGVPVAWCDWTPDMKRLKWEHAEPCANA